MNIEAAVAAGRSAIGVPFTHQGRTATGLDCIGLALLMYRAGGWEPLAQSTVETTYPRRATDGRTLPDLIKNECERVIPVMAEPLDLMLIKYEGDPYPNHVAVVTQGNPHPLMIHTHPCFGEVREHSIDDYWLGMTVGCFRLKELCNG